MQNYFVLRSLKGTQKPDKDVRVLFATNPNRKAILFIHGFSGDAITTWSDFHELIPDSVKISGSDIYFYGYDGLRAEMNASASIFRDFLNRMFTKTKEFLHDNLPKSVQRPEDFEYDDIVIVAHSLGAVISRRAILDAVREHMAWTDKIKLILYAPAHKGARIVDLALEASSSFPFLKWFGLGARFKSPLIDQLKPGSTSLINLLEDTETETKDGHNPQLIAKKVIIAEYETIVENENFASDPAPITIPDTTHITVCKPNQNFKMPLTLLEESV